MFNHLIHCSIPKTGCHHSWPELIPLSRRVCTHIVHVLGMFDTFYMLKTSIIRVTNVSGLGHTQLTQQLAKEMQHYL
jgi:hypothetical protein